MPPTGLRIGIDARAATEVKAGRGRVVRELLRTFAQREDPHTYRCYARTEWDEPLGPRFSWSLTGAVDPLWHGLVAARAQRECDVFLATNSYLSVLLNRVPTVAIVYDLVIFDPTITPNRRSLVVERLTLGRTVARAGELVCISHTTAAELVARYPAAADHVSVALLGVSRSVASPGAAELAGLPEPGFVLAVGTLEPRKNLPRLVAAYSRLAPELQAAHPLVVVGAQGWSTGPTMAALAALGERCVMLGHVSDGVLSELYRRCAVFCYPSLAEGFGLPVLEAMAAGAAVVTSDTSSLPEVGGDAVQYADPRSVPGIAAALTEVLTSPERRRELSDRARDRAASFSWEATAETVLAALVRGAIR